MWTKQMHKKGTMHNKSGEHRFAKQMIQSKHRNRKKCICTTQEKTHESFQNKCSDEHIQKQENRKETRCKHRIYNRLNRSNQYFHFLRDTMFPLSLTSRHHTMFPLN